LAPIHATGDAAFAIAARHHLSLETYARRTGPWRAVFGALPGEEDAISHPIDTAK
jgi:hypothetical protein